VVTNNLEPKEYIGMTGNTFKKRLYNHNKSFNNAGTIRSSQNTCRT
jgi:hypothetical protein